MLAGRIIEDGCEPEKCAEYRLHTSYPGIWLDPQYSNMGKVRIYTQPGIELKYTENDFYIVTRSSVIQNTTKFPEGIEPFAVVNVSGYVQSYVFRGDVLANAGFRF